MESLLINWWMLAFAILGMFAHILKENVRGESAVDIWNYFSYHLKSTVISIIATFVGFVIYATQLKTNGSFTVVDMGFVFGIGYLSESFFNRTYPAPKKEDKKE